MKAEPGTCLEHAHRPADRFTMIKYERNDVEKVTSVLAPTVRLGNLSVVRV